MTSMRRKRRRTLDVYLTNTCILEEDEDFTMEAAMVEKKLKASKVDEISHLD